jgi:hypothetical protein
VQQARVGANKKPAAWAGLGDNHVRGDLVYRSVDEIIVLILILHHTGVDQAVGERVRVGLILTVLHQALQALDLERALFLVMNNWLAFGAVHHVALTA